MNKFYKLNGSKYRINHDFFKSINSEEQAYLLGFYVADGNVNEKRKTFRVKIQKTDEEIINMFSKYIAPESRITIIDGYIIKGRNGKEYQGKDQICIDINSSSLVNSLVELGYGYNKTYEDLSLPDLSDELMIHFIRGYFDGDGSITKWIAKERGKKDRVRCKIDFSNKKCCFLKEIKSFLFKNGIDFKLNYLQRDNMYRLCVSSKSEIEKFKNLIYKNSSLYLSRKKFKFDQEDSEILQTTTEDCNA